MASEAKRNRFHKLALYEQIGGAGGCQRLSHIFHEKIAEDPELRKIFPKNMSALSERFALFLGETLGGPTDYTAKRGKQSLICRHAHLSISTSEADLWLKHMFAAMDESGIVEPIRTLLREYFTETAQTLTDPFLPLYQLSLDGIRPKIKEDPTLLQPSHMGHSLLREAVCRWDAERVRFLLESGANANDKEPLGHGPLYRAANAHVRGSEEQGRDIVRLLLKHGAEVDHQSGPSKTTPLHMAARRGNVLIAEALLDGGADIERRDSKGETPLRRAVNCGQEAMVVFLISRGANTHSRDKQDRTPFDAARNDRIRQALSR